MGKENKSFILNFCLKLLKFDRKRPEISIFGSNVQNKTNVSNIYNLMTKY